jgi:hypothetical protein
MSTQAQIEPTPKSELETAGPELDAWIAEHLFGLMPNRGPFVTCPEDCDWPGNHRGKTLIPSYSGGIENAWRVVQRMRELRYTLLLNVAPISTNGWNGPCGACFFRDGNKAFAAETNSCPLSIALAVKRALEGA